MKGIIFNLFENFITKKFGDSTYEEIINSCDTGSFNPLDIVGPGSYPDELFTAILNKSSEITKKSTADILREMGRHSLPILADRYPHFFDDYKHPRDFLKTASMIHQVEVRKLYQDAEVPKFFIDTHEDGETILTYKSRRLLCHFAEGLIYGLGDHYRIPINITQTECVQNGDKICKFNLKFQEK
ncbi:MAG: heme NO-binding domain-containing protein [Desulfobulbaceae bacterium]|nr:heme NO-binding domain-containing protein [Desulfobulbaceae bacterium]